MDDHDRTASLMTPAKLAEARPQAPVSPTLWLDQMAADAGRQHLRRLAELCATLRAFAEGDDVEPLASQAQALGMALKQLDLGLLNARGLWARATGQARRAGVEFTAQVEHVEQAVRDLMVQARGWQARRVGESGTVDRTLVEFAVEVRAIEKIIDQGSRWLNDMRNQLKTRQAGTPDAQALQQIKDDSARCEILVERLKVLRAASNATQLAHEQSQELATQRAALPKAVQQTVLPGATALHQQLTSLAAQAGDNTPAPKVEATVASQRELRRGIKQLLAQRQQGESRAKALAASLGALARQLGTTG